MKIVYDEKGRLSEIKFDKDDNQKEFWDAFVKTNKDTQLEITNRLKISETELTNRAKETESEITNRTKLIYDAQYQLITAGSIGLLPTMPSMPQSQ